MSNSCLSGFDSEAVGFTSAISSKKSETTASTQTSEFAEGGMGTQTNLLKDCGSSTSEDNIINEGTEAPEYPPPGLNEFLRKIVPAVLEQLNENETKQEAVDLDSESSSDDETLTMKPLQELNVTDMSLVGGGDDAISVLSLSWSSAGNSLAVSIGRNHHENWCSHDGLIRVYTVRQSSKDKLTHSLDIQEKNCVSTLAYHPSVSALLAYGTVAGEVVLNDFSSAAVLTSPTHCHAGSRVSGLLWAGTDLANRYLTGHVANTGKRRRMSDQVLISSGFDGTINIWHVNAGYASYNKVFENIVTYKLGGNTPAVSCFDFIQSFPLQSVEERCPDDVFVVGTNVGGLFLCKASIPPDVPPSLDTTTLRFVRHATAIVSVQFNYQRPGVFVSLAIDREYRLYNIQSPTPIKVVHTEIPISCFCSLPLHPAVAAIGAHPGGVVLYNIQRGRRLDVRGMEAGGTTAVAVNKSSFLASGDSNGTVRIWEIPSLSLKEMSYDMW